jgi:penicillin-binding protein 2
MRQREEFDLLRGRISVISYFIIAAVVILTFGFWKHQMVQSSYYAQAAERNRVRDIPLIAPRGKIYDRNHRLLADNRPSYNIVLIRENSPHTVAETVKMLSPGIDMPEREMLDTIHRRLRQPAFRPIVLKEDVSVADIAFVKAHRYELPEISVEVQPRRRYPEGEVAAHVLGYVGEVNEAELSNAEFFDNRAGDQIGKAGLERQYNAILRGRDGFKRVIVNTQGREMGKLEEEQPISGSDLYTTIDLDLQRAAEEAIGERTGVAVAIDPNTGEVLALVSKPAFDPSLFATRISRTDWNSLISDPRKPLQNRAIQNRYSPGSVFKMFMAAAALEYDVVTPLDTMFCHGHETFYGRSFACHGKHDTVGLHEAIVSSCNVFFYNVGKELGIDRIFKFATTMGLGRKTGIDLPNEDSGLIPSSEWKQRVYKTAWYPGETISVSIGQGYVNVTPLQATWAMGGLATGGRLRQPHLVNPQRIQDLGFEVPDLRNSDYTIRQSTVDAINLGMWGVVNEAGTATVARVDGFDVAGKTGTAQVVGKQANLQGQQYQDHAWFVGFAPYRNPEIVVGAFIENGGFGGVAAAPVAHAILETYYKKKTGRFNDGRITAIAADWNTEAPVTASSR